VTITNSVYPFIDPKDHYDAQTFTGKVVLITGGSRGIGLETALHFARAGASLTIVARKQEALDASRDAILRERPSAQVLTFPADVRDVEKAAGAVAATRSSLWSLGRPRGERCHTPPVLPACHGYFRFPRDLRSLVKCLGGMFADVHLDQ